MAAVVALCSGARRVFWNLVLRINNPEGVTSENRNHRASRIRKPVAARSPIKVE